MHCLDCRTAGTNSPTIGVCQECGAGVCALHARIAPRSVRLGSPLGAPGEIGAASVCLVTVSGPPRPAPRLRHAPGTAHPARGPMGRRRTPEVGPGSSAAISPCGFSGWSVRL
ncbi:DUF2180 family protein [Streptomyces sp. NPDC051064]|uniref:DUF2180 family protein n=1 Tax=Streptomyces sp. NPDC051064 TaxID=3365641 RepID=UPI0037AA542C